MRVSVLPSKHQRFVPATGGSALRGSLHSERPTVGGCGGHGGSRSPRERQDERRDLRIDEHRAARARAPCRPPAPAAATWLGRLRRRVRDRREFGGRDDRVPAHARQPAAAGRRAWPCVRLLVVADEHCGSPGLWQAIYARLAGAVAVHLVVSVHVSHLHYLTNDEREEFRDADDRARLAIGLLRQRGVSVSGGVGSDDPLESMTDSSDRSPRPGCCWRPRRKKTHTGSSRDFWPRPRR
jgi:hypothetical protein